MKKILSILLMSVAFSAQAQTMQAQQFENQWEKPVALNAETQWVVISQVKDAGKMVKEAFTALELKDLEQYKLIYIADISAMPGFITSMFAIPKMRDYAFPVALIKEEEQLSAMQLSPADKELVLVLQLNDLEVVASQSFSDQASLQAFLTSTVMASASK